MDGFDLSGFGGQPQRLGRDLQKLCGTNEIEPGLDTVLCGFEHRDTIVRAHRGDALAGPSIAVACLEAVVVKESGYQIVAGDQHQPTHSFDDVNARTVALSASTLGQAHLAVDAAYPVDDENDLGSRIVDIGHDLHDEGAHDALLQSRVGRRR